MHYQYVCTVFCDGQLLEPPPTFHHRRWRPQACAHCRHPGKATAREDTAKKATESTGGESRRHNRESHKVSKIIPGNCCPASDRLCGNITRVGIKLHKGDFYWSGSTFLFLIDQDISHLISHLILWCQYFVKPS